MSGAKETYDAFAASYDDFNHRYMYERWTGKLLERAEASGLLGRRLLDVGCGTGLSFLAQLHAGFEVVGCDISPAMLAKAREKVGARARLVEADMRRLPVLGEFDLVWSVNDSMNYLMDGAELKAALEGMRVNLAPGGVIVFDLNTLSTYRTFFAEEVVVEHEGRRFVWRGIAAGPPQPGPIYEAWFDGQGEGVEAHAHRQRHFDKVEALVAITEAGLRCVEMLGERNGELDHGIDEGIHTKAVYVCKADGDTSPPPDLDGR